MKRRKHARFSLILALLMLGLMIVGCTPVNGDQSNKTDNKETVEVAETQPDIKVEKTETKSHLTVLGESTKSIKPTIAFLDIGVTTNAAELKDAQTDNNSKMNAVINAIKENGIPDEDIQTSNYNMYPQYDMETYSKVIGYNVMHTINVTVRDMEKAGQIMDIAVDNGANSAHNMSFGITDDERESLYVEAMKSAIENGQVKANSLAEGMGVSLKGPVEVIEGSKGYSMTPRYDMEMKAEEATSFMPGELKINATVTLIYEY